jgi:hypothetical protein
MFLRTITGAYRAPPVKMQDTEAVVPPNKYLPKPDASPGQKEAQGRSKIIEKAFRDIRNSLSNCHGRRKALKQKDKTALKTDRTGDLAG